MLLQARSNPGVEAFQKPIKAIYLLGLIFRLLDAKRLSISGTSKVCISARKTEYISLKKLKTKWLLQNSCKLELQKAVIASLIINIDVCASR